MGGLTIRIDDVLKKEAEQEFAKLGVSHTDVITGTYQFVVQNHRLPYVEGEDVMFLMTDKLTSLSVMVEGFIVNVQELKFVSEAFWDSIIESLNRFTSELESGWITMKKACNGHIPPEWTYVLQSAKGLSYLLSMTASPCKGGRHVKFENLSEIEKASGILIDGAKKLADLSPDFFK